MKIIFIVLCPSGPIQKALFNKPRERLLLFTLQQQRHNAKKKKKPV